MYTSFGKSNAQKYYLFADTYEYFCGRALARDSEYEIIARKRPPTNSISVYSYRVLLAKGG